MKNEDCIGLKAYSLRFSTIQEVWGLRLSFFMTMRSKRDNKRSFKNVIGTPLTSKQMTHGGSSDI
jgi:hypothetical protein